MINLDKILSTKPWWVQKSEMIECSRAYIDMKTWELNALKIALKKNDMPKDILQELWRGQRFLLALIKEELAVLESLRKS